MVRVIEVPTATKDDLPRQVEKRKEVIHKISIRSNLQNPIKQWNLVATDDFQNELSQYFWGKKLYYERRQNEWRSRKFELSSLRITKGPDIRWMTQLIASFNYNKKRLGPAVAKGALNELFEEEPYAIIRNTSPAVAYQLYLLAQIMDCHLRELGNLRKYIANIRRHVNLCLFALLCKTIQGHGAAFGSEELELCFERAYEEHYYGTWQKLVKAVTDFIVADFKKESATLWKSDRDDLTPANYFKTRAIIGRLVEAPLPKAFEQLAARVVG